VLHLAGYDDHRPRDFARMHAREDELLAEMGLNFSIHDVD
jgi:ssRNA-specific RNase YbeY (16S rRNA maturation enzyme)